jgi:replicative DNA helicase
MSDDLWNDEQPTETRFGRPRDVMSERTLAASVMDRPDLIDELADTFDPVDFTDDTLAWVWHAVDELRHAHKGPVPWFAVDQQLQRWKAEGNLPIVPMDGPHLAELYNESMPGASIYADKITAKASASRLYELGVRAQQLAISPAFDVDREVADTQNQLDAVIRGNAGSTPRLVGDLLPEAIERAITPRTAEDRIPTGLNDLDELLGGGWAGGRLIIIGARPGVGKTTVGQGFARAAAITNKLPTFFSSLEMGEDELMAGILSAEAGVALNHISHGTTDNQGAYRLSLVAARVAEAPLYIDDATHVSLPSLRGQIRHLVRTAGLRLVIVDYLQLMQAPKAESRQVAVSALSRGLKLLAKEFGITVIVLSQLNRGSEQRADKRPTISDLRESGAIEQDADMVILVHRPDMYEPESARAGEADLIVDKHRGGQRKTITTAWQGHYARAVDMAHGFNNPHPAGLSAAPSYDTEPEQEAS